MNTAVFVHKLLLWASDIMTNKNRTYVTSINIILILPINDLHAKILVIIILQNLFISILKALHISRTLYDIWIFLEMSNLVIK